MGRCAKFTYRGVCAAVVGVGSVTVNSVRGEEESCAEEEAFELGFETGGKNNLGKQQGQQ